MQIITGKKRDRIIFGRDIEIVVLNISGNRVKLGIKATGDVPAWRKELVHALGSPSPGKPR